MADNQTVKAAEADELFVSKLAKEVRESIVDRKLADIQKKNEKIRRRFVEVEVDRKQAETAGCAVSVKSSTQVTGDAGKSSRSVTSSTHGNDSKVDNPKKTISKDSRVIHRGGGKLRGSQSRGRHHGSADDHVFKKETSDHVESQTVKFAESYSDEHLPFEKSAGVINTVVSQDDHRATFAAGFRPRPPVAVSERNDSGVRLVEETEGSLKIQINYSTASLLNQFVAPQHRGPSRSRLPSRGGFQRPPYTERRKVEERSTPLTSQQKEVHLPADALHESEDVPHFDRPTERGRGQGGNHRRGLRRGEWRQRGYVTGMAGRGTARPVDVVSASISVQLDQQLDSSPKSNVNTGVSRSFSSEENHSLYENVTQQSQQDPTSAVNLRGNNSGARSGHGRVRIARGGGCVPRPYSPRRARGSFHGRSAGKEQMSDMVGVCDTISVQSIAVDASQSVVEDWDADSLPVETTRHKKDNLTQEKYAGLAVDQLSAENMFIVACSDNNKIDPAISRASLEAHELCDLDHQNSGCAPLKKTTVSNVPLSGQNCVREDSIALIEEVRSEVNQNVENEDTQKSFSLDLQQAEVLEAATGTVNRPGPTSVETSELPSSDLQPATTVEASMLPSSNLQPATTVETSELPSSDLQPATTVEASELPSSDLQPATTVEASELPSSDLQPATTVEASMLPSSYLQPATTVETSELPSSDLQPATTVEASELPSSDLQPATTVEAGELPSSDLQPATTVEAGELPSSDLQPATTVEAGELPSSDLQPATTVEAGELPSSDLQPATTVEAGELPSSDLQSATTVEAGELHSSDLQPAVTVEAGELPSSELQPATTVEAGELPSSELQPATTVEAGELPSSDLQPATTVEAGELPSSELQPATTVEAGELPSSELQPATTVEAGELHSSDLQPAVTVEAGELPSSDLQPATTVEAGELPSSDLQPATAVEASMLPSSDCVPATTIEASQLPCPDLEPATTLGTSKVPSSDLQSVATVEASMLPSSDLQPATTVETIQLSSSDFLATTADANNLLSSDL